MAFASTYLAQFVPFEEVAADPILGQLPIEAGFQWNSVISSGNQGQ
jgi:hypothetical protein